MIDWSLDALVKAGIVALGMWCILAVWALVVHATYKRRP